MSDSQPLTDSALSRSLPVVARDGGQDVRAHFDARTRQYLRRIVNDELIREHRRDPHAQHRSEPLGRLLFYFKNLPLARQYALCRTPAGGYRITDIPRPGQRPVVQDPTEYPDAESGFHGIFLRKIKDLMDHNDG